MSMGNMVGVLVAALGGAAVGLERQWSGHADGPRARFAGIRTFTMLGALGGFSGSMWTASITTPAAILLAGAVAIVVLGYSAASDRTSMAQPRWPRSWCSRRDCSPELDPLLSFL